MSQSAKNEWDTAERRATIAAMNAAMADPVLAELAALRAELAELKHHMMAPHTSLIIGAEAVAAFRRLREGGAA